MSDKPPQERHPNTIAALAKANEARKNNAVTSDNIQGGDDSSSY
jgi:hypothetical protein